MNDKHTSLGKELLEAMKEVNSHTRGKISLPSRAVNIPQEVDVKNIRTKFGFSQREFAEYFGFSLSSVKDWEQGRRNPERAARILLTIIDRDPQVINRIFY
jgi:putative transcriptional regulator